MGEDLSRLDADPQGETLPGRCVTHLDRRAEGAESIVLVYLRHAEDGDQTPARKARRSRAVSLRNLRQRREKTFVEGVHRLRIGGGRGVVAEAGREDRDRFPAGDDCCSEGRWRRQGRVVDEDRVLELAELRPLLEAELVPEQLPRRPEAGEGLGLPAAPVERTRELTTEPFVERMLGDQGLELPDQFDVTAERELRVEKVLLGRESIVEELRQLDRREELELALCERRPAPERESGAKLRCPRRRVAQQPRVGHESPELANVGLLRPHVEDVSGRPEGDEVGAEQAADLGDAVLERCLRRRRRPLAPQRVQ